MHYIRLELTAKEHIPLFLNIPSLQTYNSNTKSKHIYSNGTKYMYIPNQTLQ